MPELPEVETTKRGIEPFVVGETIAAVVVRNKNLRWPAQVPQALVGQQISHVGRRAKYLLITTPIGTLIVHLGMSGSLRLVDAKAAVKTHDHIDLQFDSGHCLRYNDPRRFGSFHFYKADPAEHWLLAGLGPEPLGNDFSGEHLFQLARRRRIAVKNHIMDSKVVVGVGNIYAAEALFSAGIRPTVQAGRVTRVGYERLASHISKILARAIQVGGTTLRDFVGSDGQPGYFRQSLNVYGRAGEPCRVCSSLLKGMVLGQRATVYCPKCQKASGWR
ncbi:MAG: bifunctional DNA-formamidopyrimidine glycosylase/DNA-(apurinic or apyrimidinic site) lyase [Candidatus Azotimanducaceae bacterium]